MGAALVVALVVVPLIEIYLLIQVGQVLGGLPTIGLLLLMSVIGAVLLKREGRRAWTAFRSATGSGRLPAKEVADGALIIFGGALLLTPGFFTDVVGLLCVLPVSRGVVRRSLTGLLASRFGLIGMAGGLAADRYGRRGGSGAAAPGPGAAPSAGPVRGPDGVVEGEVVHDDEDPPQR